MDQEHGDEIHIIRNGERPPRGDGVILVERDVAGIIKTADCLALSLLSRITLWQLLSMQDGGVQ